MSKKTINNTTSSPSANGASANGATEPDAKKQKQATKARLSNDVLAKAAEAGVKVPTYDRTKVQPGVLHLGVGNFHRSHFAAYMDDLMNQDFEDGKNWGIVGGGIMHFDQAKRDLLQPQDWLQTLVERDADSITAKILGSMIDFLPINTESIEKFLQNPSVKIASLTVTEGGYFLKDGKFDLSAPQIQNDVKNPDSPRTVFGVLCKAIRYRKDNNLTPFTILSCDNIPHNGDVVRSVVVGLAKAQDPDIVPWIEANMAFPNSMVDRITPGTTEEQKKYVSEMYGFEDASPVFSEPFRQWVLEDKFTAAGRPHLEQLENVKFVPDVVPYEFMKIRILNGGHASLCYPAALLDVDYVHESMLHPTISAFLDSLEHTEIIPTIPPVPDTSLVEYWETIASRFSNPTIKDTIGRICYDGASRQPKFIVGVIQDNLKADRSVKGMSIVSAMWCRYCQGKTESGKDILPNDPQWDRLQELALRAQKTPKVWLEELEDVYGDTVDPKFVAAFEESLFSIQNDGAEATMKKYIEEYPVSNGAKP